MSDQPCPPAPRLRDFALGKLSEAELEEVAAHLEDCPECDATLAGLDPSDDTLVAGLRDPGEEPAYVHEPECGRAVALAGAVAEKGPAASPPDEPAELGTLGDYELLAKLGEGGMGTVYKALHTRLKRVVALKVLPRNKTADEKTAARFEREMEAVGRLNHPNIVQAHDAREIDGTAVLVMEYVDGLDLSELVRRTGPLPVADACEIIRQAAVGLQYAHQNGLVHRDVKPSNLMLQSTRHTPCAVQSSRHTPCADQSSRHTPCAVRPADAPSPPPLADGTRSVPATLVKILDLGLALLGPEQPAAGDEPGELTAAGHAMGTADYMAPEQAADAHAVDIRADVYSLGCTLFKLLTGRAPFTGPKYKRAFDKMMGHVRDQPPPIQSLRPEVPDELAALVHRMMAKDPTDRPATPGEVAAALAALPLWQATGTTPGDHDLTPLLTKALNSPSPTPSPPPTATAPHLSSALTTTAPHHQPTPPRRRPPRWALPAAMAPLFLIALGVVIWINKTRVEVPDGSEVRIGQDDSVEVVTPDQLTRSKLGGDSGGAAHGRITPSHSRVELLTLVDPAKDAVEGEWHRDSLSLGVEQGEGEALLQLPVAPAGGYSLDVRLRRLSHGEGDHALGLSVPVGGASVLVVLDEKGGMAGLSRVGGRALAEGNGTGVAQDRIEDGTTHSVMVVVRPKEDQFKIVVIMDGEPLFDWQGSPDALSLPADWKAPNPRAISLFARGWAIQFDHIRFVSHYDNRDYTEVLRPHLDKVLAMQDAALVPRPAPLPGVLCWTIEPREPGPMLRDLAVSPDGRILAVLSKDPSAVHLIDIATGKPIRRLPCEDVATLNWSRDGSKLAVTGEHNAVVWDTVTWEKVGGFRHTAGYANNAVVWSPDGRTLAMAHSMGGGKVVHLYDVATAEHREIDAGAPIAAIAWPSMESLIALLRSADGEEPVIRVFDVQSGELEREFGLSSSSSDIDVSTDGTRITDGCAIWDWKTGSRLRHVACGGNYHVAWSPSGNIVASVGINGPLGPPKRCGAVFADAATGRVIGWGGYVTDHAGAVGAWLNSEHIGVGSIHAPPEEPHRVHVYDLNGFVTSAIELLPAGGIAVVTPDGHWRGSEGAERHLQYAVLTETGERLTLTPAEFGARYGWQNDPEKVRLVPEGGEDSPAEAGETASGDAGQPAAEREP